MKRILFLIAAILLLASPLAAANSCDPPMDVCETKEPIQLARMNGYIAGSGAAALTCTIGSGDNWVNTANNDNWSLNQTDNQNGQEVANTGSKDICKVVIRFSNGGSDSTTYLQIKDGWGGSVLGTSDTLNILGSSAQANYTFTFATPATVAGNFVVVIRNTQVSGQLTLYVSNSDQYYGGTSYKATTANTERNQDMVGEIWYKQ